MLRRALFLVAPALLLPALLFVYNLVNPPVTLYYTLGSSSESRPGERGERSLEERIARSDYIVRATMSSMSSSSVAIEELEDYRVIMEFTFKVHEYLKGQGPSEIVAVWIGGWEYSSLESAEMDRPDIVARRDTQWDSRESIVFMRDLSFPPNWPGPTFEELFTEPERQFLSFGFETYKDDNFSLHSKEAKLWLPSAVPPDTALSSTSTAENKAFLLDLPGTPDGALADALTDGTAYPGPPTINLADLKAEVKKISDRFAGGNGSEEFKHCVEFVYEYERTKDYYGSPRNGGLVNHLEPWNLRRVSGRHAGTVLHTYENRDRIYSNVLNQIWFEGKDASLFTQSIEGVSSRDSNGDGKITPPRTAGTDLLSPDRISYTQKIITTRPIPAGEYTAVKKEIWPAFSACKYTISVDWNVTYIAPDGTIHEAFFDPVALAGGGVGADTFGNGVLRPQALTFNGKSSSLESLSWQSGKVTLALTDGIDLTGLNLDFINLNGNTALSLKAGVAPANSTKKTYTWPVANAPWAAGDLLMIRLREASTTVTPVTPTATPGGPTPTPVPPTATPVGPTPTPVPPTATPAGSS